MVRIIASRSDIAEGTAHLARLDPRLAAVSLLVGEPPLRREAGGFAGLAAIIVSQQVSTASAAAIWARCRRVFDPMTPETVLRAEDEAFGRAGLSGPKRRALRALAAAAEGLRLEEFPALEADEARRRLVAVTGIGPWTADIYLMFCLGHADAFAAGDLALQEAARAALGLARRPDTRTLQGIAEAWRPWRGVAARLLWAYYRQLKAGRDGAPLAPGVPT